MPSKQPRHRTASAAIDPRLARVHTLIDEVHPHGAVPGTVDENRFSEVLDRLFKRVRWELVECAVVKSIFATITKLSDDEDGLRLAQEEVLNELAAVADEEHRSFCACCRRGKGIGRRAVNEPSLNRDEPRRPSSIGELRKIVKRAVFALASEDSPEAFESLELILDCLGWAQNFTKCTSKQMRDGICALADVSSHDDVDSAARQSLIEAVKHLKRHEPGAV